MVGRSPSTPEVLDATTSGGLSVRRRLLAMVLAVVGIPALTAVLVAVRGSLSLDSVLLVYLLGVVVVAVVGGLLPALVAAVVSFLLANWPYGTFEVADRDRFVELVVFVVVATLVSVVVDVGARNRARAERTQAEAAILSRLTTSDLGTRSADQVLQQTRELFDLDRVELVEGTWPEERSVLLSTDPAASASDRDPEPTVIVPTDSELVLLGFGAPHFAHDNRLLRALAETVARSWKEQLLADEAAKAEQLAASDRLRAALLAAVSHDLRTPLAGVKAAVSTLRQEDLRLTDEQSAELLESIELSADRLARLIADLLDMSRLQSGAVSAQLAPVSVEEVVAHAALDQAPGEVIVEESEGLPLVYADGALLERVVGNLLVNAAAYSPPDAPCAVRASVNGDGKVSIAVVDHGPGVPAASWSDMFRPFQRLGDNHNDTGVGLGLAIAQGFTDAMGATITPSDTPGGGLTMTVTLPVAT
jgi:K+-sensing histidine kinase KdpD